MNTTLTRETNLLPTEFTPQSADDFVGPARLVAKSLESSARMCMPRGTPAAHLLLGKSGSGKTALAEFALKLFDVNQWNLNEYFGSDMSVDTAREIATSMHYTSLYPGYRAWFFDEFNMATKDARDRALQYCGERKQPRETLIIATANMSVEEFEHAEKTSDAKGRLTSRFQIHEVVQPTAKEAAELLTRWLPAKDAKQLADIAATDASGKIGRVNMRALLKDAITWMQG